MSILITPTPVTSFDNIDYVGSPKHVTINNTVDTWDSALMYLYIWDGDLDKPVVLNLPPTIILQKAKVSPTDTYVEFEIGDIIQSYINPSFQFTLDEPITSGECVYYQYYIDYLYQGSHISGVAGFEIPTRLATLGYNWAYEGEFTFVGGNGSFGFYNTNIPKYYSPYIDYYDTYMILSGATNTEDMTLNLPASYGYSFKRCTPDQYVIYYLDRNGFWNNFTPAGKVIVSNNINRESYNRAYRKIEDFNPQLNHQTIQYNVNSRETYTINTGVLYENMGELVEEILYSPKVYLVKFKPQLDTNPLTVDTTLFSADTTGLSADLIYATKPNYVNYLQIPVVVKDSDFGRKTKLNDRNKISYNIKFEMAYDKINNIK